MTHLDWQKSSFSGTNTNCLEIASEGEPVHIRESDDPTHIVTTTPAVLHTWLHTAKAGHFDHLTA
ncbi:DUF397 domain-containing protein [Kitasatospora brasiliensis]|uniref:DUF397 domain-containing protein n=1 Tax=Kitasatospora brasiliensis TaxID=3058040 RepID=UPI002930C459|nr:DUF397 domain-containing protein [Kitasatospora sp. K002]